MHFSKIHLENLLSFESTDFEFQDYNVIVGINNSGKTNLVRILQELTNSDLTGYRLNKNAKFSPKKRSYLTLDLKLEDAELKLLFQSIFERSLPSTQFPDSLKSVKLIINFSDIINDISIPATIMIVFNNGLWVVADHNNIIVFNIDSNDEITSDALFTNIQYNNLNQIINYLQKTMEFELTDEIPSDPNFYSDLILGKNIVRFFRKNTRKRIYRHTSSIKFDTNEPQQYISEIYDYVGHKKVSPSIIHFSYLLSKIIKKNFILIEEIHPTYSQLTNSLFKLKVVNEKAYQLLQESFSSVFNGITVKVEQDSENENDHRIIISENDRDFEMEESASGHYAAIHILHTILNKPGTVLLLDEPEVHFHPVKIRQLSQKFMELTKINNNQIIVITHSPKFVDFRLLDPAYPYSLLNMTKENNASKVSTMSPRTDIALSPHLFNPDMYFGNCSLLVEGADDEFVMRSISDKFDGILDRFGVTIIDCWGVNNIYPTIKLHQEYNIPFLALVDKEYTDNLENVIRLDDKLESELTKTGWSGSKSELKPEIAYYYIQDLLETRNGFEKLKSTDIWNTFVKVLELSNSKLPNFDDFYSDKK